MWINIAKFAFTVLITAVGKISPQQWAQLGTVITSWLQALEDKLPVGHPMIAMLNSYRAPRSKLAPPKPESDEWGS